MLRSELFSIEQLKRHAVTLAGHARRRLLADFFREMWIAPVVALELGVVLAWTLWSGGRAAELFFVAPVLLLWLLSPVVGWWISMPLATRTGPDRCATVLPADVGPANVAFLRGVCRPAGQLAAA